MEIEFVDRNAINTTKKRASKYKPLLKALDELKAGGKAVKVQYRDEKEANSMRTAVYNYTQEKNVKIKSNKDSQNQWLFFYRE